jgi:hypothetical protein
MSSLSFFEQRNECDSVGEHRCCGVHRGHETADRNNPCLDFKVRKQVNQNLLNCGSTFFCRISKFPKDIFPNYLPTYVHMNTFQNRQLAEPSKLSSRTCDVFLVFGNILFGNLQFGNLGFGKNIAPKL